MSYSEAVAEQRVLPAEIEKSILRFRQKHPDAKHKAFIMMDFGKPRKHGTIVDSIRATLKQCDIEGLRADDEEFHTDLHWNVVTYIHGCGFGIAVFETVKRRQSFNPNVAFEVGHMTGLAGC